MTPFELAVARVLDSEGRDAFTDRPHDKGGPTRWGITWRTLIEALVLGVVFAPRPLTSDEIASAKQPDGRPSDYVVSLLKQLPRDKAVQIYLALYWQRMACDQVSGALGYALFDAAVNSGIANASRWLQRSLVKWGAHVEVDGAVGPMTVAASKRFDPSALVDAFLAVRAEALCLECQKDPTQQADLHGWLVREFRVRAEAAMLPLAKQPAGLARRGDA